MESSGEHPELVESVRAALEGRAGPPQREPWLAWLTVALCRQRARQDWLAEVLTTHLSDVDDQIGEVPGLPGWRFDFHGSGLCLTGPDSEAIDVDFHEGDDGPQTIDPYFFTTRVLVLDPKPPVEQRLSCWFGAAQDLLVEGLGELRARGVIQHPRSQHVFHLHPWLEANYRAVADVDFSDEAVWRAWALALHDAPAEQAMARDAFATWGLTLLDEPGRSRVIGALAPLLPREVAVQACERIIAGPMDSSVGRSIRALRTLGLAPVPAALALLERLDPTEHNPFSACELAEWLLESGDQARGMALVRRFSSQRVIKGFRGNPFDATYAVLALRFSPGEALNFVRQGLRSTTPNSVHQLGALLSVLGEPWCWRELLLAARDVDDVSRRRFLVACLLFCDDAALMREAEGLMPSPPERSEHQVGYTYDEVIYANLRSEVAYYRERAAATAEVVRRAGLERLDG